MNYIPIRIEGLDQGMESAMKLHFFNSLNEDL